VEEMEESATKIEAEKAVYKVLMKRPHPNILQCILCAPEGLFLRRMDCTLLERLSQSATTPIPSETQEKWVQQLTSALAWLEQLDFVHGDLRPANILLDANEEIKLADFDATVRPGEELKVAGVPFCKTNAKCETPLAGPESEQYSLASCIYTIRFGHWPWHGLTGRAMFERLARNEFPPTSADPLLGDLITSCWFGKYESIAAVEKDVLRRLGRTVDSRADELDEEAVVVDGSEEFLSLRAECEAFIASHQR
jgi:serine/threonine protein kinase